MGRILAMAALVLAACAGVDVQVQRDAFESQGRAAYPTAHYLSAFGEGPTRAEAEASARAAVAALVKSEIAQRFSAYNEERQRDGRSVSEQRVVNEVASRVESSFGAYFKAVQARPLGRGWVALSVASRTELDAAIAAEAERRSRDADAAWARIAGAPRWLAAAPGWCEARAAAAALDELDLERQAVSGKRTWTAERAKLWAAAEQRFADAKSRTVTVVAAPEDAPPAAPPIVKALQQAGWRAEQGSAPCGGDVALTIQPRLESSCKRSSLGIEVCKASLVVEGRACEGGTIFSERSADAQATHGTDPSAALRRAVSQIPLAPVVEATQQRLLEVLGERCRAR